MPELDQLLLQEAATYGNYLKRMMMKNDLRKQLYLPKN